jgi:dTDP-glucose 4,6-dehydratase
MIDGAVLVTGGAGFIGSALCRHLVGARRTRVVNLDKLTYAGTTAALADIEGSADYRFVRADICDRETVADLLAEEKIGTIIHLAAESHVDRSIDGPDAFVRTNIDGTFRLLEAALGHWRGLDGARRAAFRFHHVSTDEVFGDLSFEGGAFTADSPYAPSSPYAASKAASDHLVRAWHRTYGLPALISNCSNNYGPYQFPEKLIPHMILSALHEEPLPVYGTGGNVRDWLHVEDHARALERIAARGRPGATYLVGGRAERTNLDVVETICRLLDTRAPRAGGGSYRDLIRFVADRPGHDRRYAIDPEATERELGWRTLHDFDAGLAATIDWYLERRDWWAPLRARPGAAARLGAPAEEGAG